MQLWTSEAIKPLSEIKIWLTIIIFYYFSNQRWSVLKCRSIFIISFGYLMYMHSFSSISNKIAKNAFSFRWPSPIIRSKHLVFIYYLPSRSSILLIKWTMTKSIQQNFGRNICSTLPVRVSCKLQFNEPVTTLLGQKY